MDNTIQKCSSLKASTDVQRASTQGHKILEWWEMHNEESDTPQCFLLKAKEMASNEQKV